MKLLFNLLIMVGIISMFTSCTEDSPFTPPTTDERIQISLVNGIDVLSQGSTVEAGSSFKVRISATSGSALLNSLRVLKDQNNLPTSEFTINSVTPSANPILLFGSDKTSFTYDIEILATDIEETSIYVFEVMDEGNMTGNVSIQITTESQTIAPTINYMGESTLNVLPGDIISLSIEAIMGSGNLAHIVISSTEMDIVQDVSNFYYGDLNTPFDANPFVIPSNDQQGFVKDILVRTSMDAGTISYRIVLLDSEQNSDFFDITITTAEPTIAIWGVLFNSAGPEGTGGLDLDDGVGTGSMSSIAEIKDEGIDINQPIGANWKRSISEVNGSVIKSLIPGMNGLIETFDFMNKFSKSDLVNLFDSGVDFTATNAAGDLVSPRIEIGHSFIVKNGENYYLIFIRDLQEVEDNADNYTIDIKK